MLLARLERGRKEREATGDEREFTLLILIYIIYLEEFIVNLMRFEALMPFLWILKNVNIELSIVSALFLFNSHSALSRNSMACDSLNTIRLLCTQLVSELSFFVVTSIHPAYRSPLRPCTGSHFFSFVKLTVNNCKVL